MSLKCLATAVALAVPFAAQADIFLKMDPIKGESTADRREGQVDINSFQFAAGPNNKNGRVCPSDITLTKLVDSASPALLAGSLVGTVFPKATLSFVKAGATNFEYLTIELTNVTVTAIAQSSGGDRASESLSLGYASGVYKYTPQDPKGGAAAPVTASISRNNC